MERVGRLVRPVSSAPHHVAHASGSADGALSRPTWAFRLRFMVGTVHCRSRPRREDHVRTRCRYSKAAPHTSLRFFDLAGQSTRSVQVSFKEIASRPWSPIPDSERSGDSGTFSELDLTKVNKTAAFSRSGGDARREPALS